MALNKHQIEQHSRISALPSEIQLRVVDFLPTASLPAITCASKLWHKLINDADQDRRIYHDRTEHPPLTKDFSFLKTTATCFTHYYTNYAHISSWRDLCRNQTLLGRSWSRDSPTVRTSLIALRRKSPNAIDAPRIPVWRFRPDFQRRLIIATTQHGGLLVTDMDTGNLLWSLTREEVRGYAHLEYSNGWMAFDRYGNYIEIWRHIDGSDEDRGSFEKVAELAHDVETRGFQMLWPTLCVVSTEETGFVYDLNAPNGPRLTKRMSIASGTVGHLDQDASDTVMYCVGTEGYVFHSKSSGAFLGSLNPKTFTAKGTYHVSHRHFDTPRPTVFSKHEPLPPPFPPRRPIAPHKPQAQPLRPGPNTVRNAQLPGLDRAEWGAGLIRGDLMVGISKGGHCMLCLDWPRALRSPAHAAAVTFMLELEIDATTFDFGGWLGVRRSPPGPTRIICEVDDKIYIFRLDDDDIPSLIDGEKSLTDAMDVISVPSACSPNVGVPVSFMGVYDDCIMHTCLMGVLPHDRTRGEYIAKAIRVVSFAPTPAEMGLDGYSAQMGVNGYVGVRGEEDDGWEEVNLRDFD